MTYVVNDNCVDIMDKSCVRECPVDCIYEGERAMYIHPDECIDCGACEMACPVEAICYDVDLDDDGQRFLARAEAMFVPLGPLGGARRHGALGKDAPEVAALPAKTA
ncbi:MAG: ferredoxin [Frankiales bacterium]|nr:ferredoxin [Frankiales bacterium]